MGADRCTYGLELRRNTDLISKASAPDRVFYAPKFLLLTAFTIALKAVIAKSLSDSMLQKPIKKPSARGWLLQGSYLLIAELCV